MINKNSKEAAILRPFRLGMPEAIVLLAMACLFMLLRYPGPGFEAAVQGIGIWWDVLFPALFPFLVISEMLLGFGIVHFLGTLLDPLMRPMFRIPGIGGFVVAMGFASGYPVSARLTSQLWEQGLLNREEGERLVAFTTSSDPIFLIGAVSIGFFHNVSLAAILASAHYGAALLLGFLMRFHGRIQPTKRTTLLKDHKSLLKRSFEAMHKARLNDARPLGKLPQQSIQTSIQLVLVIGGLVVFFSVIITYLSLTPVMGLFDSGLRALLSFVGLPEALSASFVSGFFEVTLGAKSAGQAAEAIPLVYKVSAAAFILSWGGLSVHAQVVSILHRTNLRYSIFAAARMIHAFLAAVLVFIVWPFLHSTPDAAVTVFNQPPRLGMTPRPIWHWVLPYAFLCLVIVLLHIIDYYDRRILHGTKRNLN
jgi:sporulation integral membrane protein YlbJ